jgi:sulfide dehydrogenase [flavocytochrome c] flavoprotein chain
MAQGRASLTPALVVRMEQIGRSRASSTGYGNAGVEPHHAARPLPGCAALHPGYQETRATPVRMTKKFSRRRFLRTAASAAALVATPALAQGAPRVVVVGGGFGGGACARELKKQDARLDVTLVEANPRFTACPGSNAVIAGLRDIAEQQFGYEAVQAAGVKVAFQPALAVDPQARQVGLGDGTALPYDRMVLAPGIDLRFGALPGYDEAAVARMPHAMKAGEQTLLLRRQIAAMEDGGVVAIVSPANPSRCPTAQYERASLIAHALKAKKPRSKVIILDAKDSFPNQALFLAAWQALYPGMIEWVPLSKDGGVTAVDPAAMTLTTDFGVHQASVVNVIPPQKAGRIAVVAGVADRTGWCPVDPVTFESLLAPRIHVIGDAVIGGAMPKAASSAAAQGRACAAAVVALLRDAAPAPPALAGICYSQLAPDYAISIGSAYHAADGQLLEVEGSRKASPATAPPDLRAREAREADAWFARATAEIFG